MTTSERREPADDVQFRDLSIEMRAEALDEAARTVELSFSSDTPYQRWWGAEILDHGRAAVRLGRLNGGAALLVNHDAAEQVGVVERAWLDGNRGYARVRFGKSQRAAEVYQDVVDGIRTLVSVGYRIHALKLEASGDDGDTYRVTDWEPFEVSLVAVPADASVGVGRDGAAPAFDPRTLIEKEEEQMIQRRDATSPSAAPTIVNSQPDPAAQQRDREAAVAEERSRVLGIRTLGSRIAGAGELAEQAEREGWSVDRFAAELRTQAPNASALPVASAPAIGMTERDQQRFSFLRLMNAIANPHDRAAQTAAGFELECGAAAQQRLGKDGATLRGVTIPLEVLYAPLARYASGSSFLSARLLGDQQRDLTVGTATAGGNTVATNLLAGSFIDILRNRLTMGALGATMLTDLSGNVAIPRQTGAATHYWVAESGAPTESQQAFDQVSLAPKTCGAFVDISRRLTLQSSMDVEAFVRGDLAAVLALAVDLAAVNGSGSSNQPRGILQTSGINAVAIGTNGGDPTWDHIVGLETEVAADNADVATCGYLTTPRARGKLKRTQRFSSTNGDPIWERGNEMNGYRAMASNQVPSNLTKGTGTNLSAILFGNFADVLIGMWGGLDLMVDPYSSSTSGTVRIVALQDVDVALRRLESFGAIVDAVTT